MAGTVVVASASSFLAKREAAVVLSPTNDKPSEVRKKAIAETAVTLPKKVTAPRPPNAVVAAPPPSAAPMPASFPGCRRITKIMKTHSRR